MSKRTQGEDKDKRGFEKSLERLEKIVEEMEAGKLSLEEMIGRFEEGQTLIKYCTGKLDEVEKKIEVLLKKEDGTVEAEPFEPADEPEEDGQGGAKKPDRELF